MAIPTDVPRWADVGGGAGGVGGNDPGALKKNTGFQYSERPSPAFFNYLFYWIYQWILYLQGFTTRTERPSLHTWYPGPASTPWAANTADYAWFSNDTTVSIGTLYIPLNLQVGDRITGYTVRVRHPSLVLSDTIRCRLWKVESDGTYLTSVGAILQSTATAATQNLTEAGLSIDVTGTDRYAIQVSGGNNGSGSTPRAVYAADVSVTVRP